MAISITWKTKVINVPQADLTFLGGTDYALDLDVFRKTLNLLQESEVGIIFDTTHFHTQPVTVGGITLARVVEIINGYTVTFENLQYAVNLVGANSNVGDVVNLNQVSVRSANTAGLVDNFKIDELWRIHGMDEKNSLIVTSISRDTGNIDTGAAISQTIVDSAGTVTVKRT